MKQKLENCLNLQEQLSLFSTKCQPILKLLIRDVKENDTEIFEGLQHFLLAMIFETDFLVEVEKQLLNTAVDQQPPEIISMQNSLKEI